MAKFSKSSDNKMLFGVCSGIARYFDIDVTIIRLIFVIGAILGYGTFLLIYIILLFLMPHD